MAGLVTSNPVPVSEADRPRVPNVISDSPGGNVAGERAVVPTNDGAKRSKKKLVMVVIVLLLVGFYAKGKFLKPHYGPGAKVPLGQIFSLGDTTITTNLSDGHLAQIAVSLQLTKPANSKEVNADVPELTSSTVEILGQQTYAGLLEPSGRENLATELLRAFQRDLGRSEGAQQISAVYFTSFVLQ